MTADTAAEPITLIVKGHQLAAAAALAAQIVERRTIPILAYAKFDAVPNPAGDGGTLTITATDVDRQLEIQIGLGQRCSFTSFCARPEILAHLAAGRDRVTIQPKGDQITVTAHKQEFEPCRAANRDEVKATFIALPDPADFPAVFTRHEAEAASIPEGVLSDALRATLPFISNEETRYYLHGVFFTAVDGRLVCVATDGHRLARFETGQPWTQPGFILPEPTARFLAGQLVASSKRPVHLLIYGNAGQRHHASHITFDAQRFILRTKTIDGAFPEQWQKFCRTPEAFTMEAAFDRSALRLLPGQSNDFFRSIRFDLDSGTFTQSDIGGDSAYTVPLNEHRGSGSFSIGQKQLEAMTRTSRRIVLHGTSPSELFFATADDPRLTMVVMPMGSVKGAKVRHG